MVHPREVSKPDVDVKEWLGTLVSICSTPEIQEFMARLEEQDQAFPQTVIQKEED